MLSLKAKTDWYFFPDDRAPGLARILTDLNAAKRRIRVRMYMLAHPAIKQALEAAGKRGVDILILLDASEELTPAGKVTVAELGQAGMAARVRETSSPVAHAYMHDKLATIDGVVVLGGSTNWTISGLEQNNVLTVTRSKVLATVIDQQFDTMWARAAGTPAPPPTP